MSPRWNWDSPTPLAASECALPPGPKGGGAHSPAAKGVGESQFQRLDKRLALCLLCGKAVSYHFPCCGWEMLLFGGVQLLMLTWMRSSRVGTKSSRVIRASESQ